MKKGIAIIAIIAFASTFVACKNKYTCTCTDGDSFVLPKQGKASAKISCSSYEYSGVTCSI